MATEPATHGKSYPQTVCSHTPCSLRALQPLKLMEKRKPLISGLLGDTCCNSSAPCLKTGVVKAGTLIKFSYGFVASDRLNFIMSIKQASPWEMASPVQHSSTKTRGKSHARGDFPVSTGRNVQLGFSCTRHCQLLLEALWWSRSPLSRDSTWATTGWEVEDQNCPCCVVRERLSLGGSFP